MSYNFSHGLYTFPPLTLCNFVIDMEFKIRNAVTAKEILVLDDGAKEGDKFLTESYEGRTTAHGRG